MYEEENVYELTKKSENNLRYVREMKDFYTSFLKNFTHYVLLEKQFLMQTFHITGEDDLEPNSSSSDELDLDVT